MTHRRPTEFPGPTERHPRRFPRAACLALLASCLAWLGSWAIPGTAIADPPAVTANVASESNEQEVKERAPKKWTQLHEKWEICRFGGEGPQEIKKDLITLGFGDPLTGVRWSGDYSRENYEIELEARRTDGFDFFAAITFPVADEHCSLVLGGWGWGRDRHQQHQRTGCVQ